MRISSIFACMVLIAIGLYARMAPLDAARAAEPAPMRQEAQGAAPSRKTGEITNGAGTEKTVLDRAPIDKGGVEKTAVDPRAPDGAKSEKAKIIASLVDAAEK